MTFDTIYDAGAFGTGQWLACGLGVGLIVLPFVVVARSGSRFSPSVRAVLVSLFAVGGVAVILLTVAANRLSAAALRAGNYATIEGPIADLTIIRDRWNRRWEKRFSINGHIFYSMSGVSNAFDDRNDDVRNGRTARITYQNDANILRVEIAR